MNKQWSLLLLLFLFGGLTLSQHQLSAQNCNPANYINKPGMNQKSGSESMYEGFGGRDPKQSKIMMVQKKVESTFLDVEFQADAVIDVGLVSFRPGQQQVIAKEYFPQIMPIINEYGGRRLITFKVVDRVQGESPAQSVTLFHWPSIEQRRAFENDPRFLKLRNIRDAAINFLTVGYFKVESAGTVRFSADKVYDFGALWLNPEEAPKMKTYFENVGPVAVKKYGARLGHVRLKPSGYQDQVYHPHIIGISEWPAVNSLHDFFKNEQVFKDNVHLREAAVEYMDVFLLKPVL